MISNTFNNLGKEKKERILDAIRTEVVNYGIDGARVTNICFAAGIPRSAFYRYFDTLEDSFNALMKSIGEGRRKKMIGVLLDDDADIYKASLGILIEIFDNPDEYILIRSVKASDFKRMIKNETKNPVEISKVDKERFLTFRLLTNLIKSAAISHYEDGVEKEELINEFKEFIKVLKGKI